MNDICLLSALSLLPNYHQRQVAAIITQAACRDVVLSLQLNKALEQVQTEQQQADDWFDRVEAEALALEAEASKTEWQNPREFA